MQIRADGTAAATGLRQVASATESIGQAADAASAGTERLARGMETAGQSGVYLNNLAQVFERIGVSVGSLVAVADEFAGLQARIRLTSDSAEGYAQAMADITGISQRVGVELKATGDLYGNLARSLKSTGDQSASVAQLTETIAQAMAISGRSAQENEAALRQLSQALASGVLRGDEFNSIMENAPRLQQALADALQVTTGKLREMAEGGQLSAETITTALGGQAAKIAREFDALPDTVSRAVVRLKNEFTLLVGSFNEASGAGALVASAIGGIAGHLDELAGLAAAAGLAAVASAATGAAASMASYATAARLAAEETRAAAALEADAARVSVESAANRARVAGAVAAANAVLVESELAAAVAAEQSARTQLAAMTELTASEEARAAAEGRLAEAILAREEAEKRAAVASELALGSQRAAAAAAESLAASSTRSAAQLGVMAQAGAGLRSALTLLKDPFNAIIAAMTAVMAYDLGAHLRQAGLDMGYAAQEGTLLAKAFALVATEGERAARATAANQDQISAKLAKISESTGITVKSMADLNKAAETGALVFDEASGAWQRGTVSLEAAYSSITKLEALYKTQLSTLEKVRAEVGEQNKVTEARNALSIETAKYLGNERAQLEQSVKVIKDQVAAKKTALTLAQAELQKAQEILDTRTKQLAQSGPLSETNAQEIAGLQKLVGEKSRAVEMANLAIASAQLEEEQAKINVATYGYQSAQLGKLREEYAKLTQSHDDLNTKVEAGKAAEDKLAAAMVRAQKTAQAYSEAALTGAANVQELGEQHQAALKEVERLRAAMVTGKAAAEKLAETDKALAKNKQLLTDASKDYQEKLKAETALAQTQANISRGLLQVKSLELQRRQAIAKAMGDEQAAASLGIQMAKLEVKETQLQAEALHLEAENLKKSTEEKIRKAQETGTYTAAVKAETAQSLKNAEALEIEAQKLDASAKLKKTEISIAAQLIDAQNAVNAVVEEYGQILAKAGEEAKKAGEAAIAAGANQYEAAEAAKRAAQDALDAAEKKAKADRESIAYTDLIATELAGLADQYEALGDTSAAAMLRSKDALGDYWQMWEAGRYPQEIQSLNEQLTRLGQRVAYVDNLTAALQSGSYSAAQLAEATRIAQTATERLGEERLEALRSAIQAAQQDMEDLKREADDTLASWQDKLDQLRGNELDIATRQRAADLADLQAQLDAALAAGNAEAQARLRQSIDLAKTYWDEYIAGLKAADEAADNANLPGITVNDDGTISGTLPEIRSGSGGSGDGTISGALSARGASTATIAKEDVNALSEALGGQISSALSQVAAGFQASGAAQRTVRLDFNLGGQSVPISTSEADADKVIAAWADAKRRGL